MSEQPQSRALVVVEEAKALSLTNAKIDLITRTVAKDHTPDELAIFLYQCRRTGLDPLSRQIYSIKRQGKATIQTGIDGYRLVAQRTKQYAGMDEVLFDEGLTEYEMLRDGREHPITCTVTVYRLVDGIRTAFWGTAAWIEYKPAPGASGNGDSMWRKMPYTMLSKCFDEQTEVLTDRGFQKFSEVTGRVMYVADDGLHTCDAQPFAQNYEGPMVTFESDDLNFRVTPNHDMITTDGKIEAGALYDQARTRPRHWIPRCIAGSRADGIDVSDAVIQLAAAYVADGSDITGGDFRVEVSRPHKVAYLEALGLETARFVRATAGDVAHTSTRTITTRSDKVVFRFAHSIVNWLVKPGKQIDLLNLQLLSRAQARVLVDALITFDGHLDTKSGVRRFYTSRPDHMAAFELAAVAAGYAVSAQTIRRSDISTKPNYMVTISSRSEIPVTRWGRSYNGDKHSRNKHTGLELTPNASGRVWCVTVPSGVIVVRRHGFSMLCGNCSEALALRRGFPQELGGIYTHEEMEQAGPAITVESRDVTGQRVPAAPAQGRIAQPAAAPKADNIERISDPADTRWQWFGKLSEVAAPLKVPVPKLSLPVTGPQLEAANKGLERGIVDKGEDLPAPIEPEEPPDYVDEAEWRETTPDETEQPALV